MDPLVISPAFQQLEQFRQYYQFPDAPRRRPLRDRRQDAGHRRRRPRPQPRGPRRRRRPGSTRTSSTRTATASSPRPATSARSTASPCSCSRASRRRARSASSSRASTSVRTRPTYSIVGAPEGGDPIELDYPAGGDERAADADHVQGRRRARSSTTSSRSSSTRSSSSPSRSSSPTRSTNDSQILYDRDPIERVQKVAPYLTLDTDAYPSVVDGRVVWIVDGYTLDRPVPVLEQGQHERGDRRQRGPRRSRSPFDEVNYIRNSVKATVDAYDGSVTLYAWDDRGPDPQDLAEDLPDHARADERDVGRPA